MTVGLEIQKDGTGHLLLTSLIANPIVRQKSVVATVTNNISHPVGTSKLVLTYTNASATSNPIPFLQGDVTFHLMSATKVSDTWTWNFILPVAVGTNITCYVFDEPTNTYGNNGIEIYADAPGTPLLFGMNTALKPLRIAAVSAVAGSVPAGRTYAAAAGKRSGDILWYEGAQDPDTGTPSIGFFALRGVGYTVGLSGANYGFGTIELDPPVSDMTGTDDPDYGQERIYPLGPAIIADVTGY